MATRADIERLWPELDWIADGDLREKTARCWELAFERSPLVPDDLLSMPFTLHVPDCSVSFMDHKRHSTSTLAKHDCPLRTVVILAIPKTCEAGRPDMQGGGTPC